MNQDNPKSDPTPQDPLQNLADIRQARDQAEILRDQLLTEFEHINKEDSLLDPAALDDPNRQQGKEAMRKAIAAANRAIASIDKALQSILHNNENQENP